MLTSLASLVFFISELYKVWEHQDLVKSIIRIPGTLYALFASFFSFSFNSFSSLYSSPSSSSLPLLISNNSSVSTSTAATPATTITNSTPTTATISASNDGSSVDQTGHIFSRLLYLPPTRLLVRLFRWNQHKRWINKVETAV
ncbi:unnamed protein product [Protopolystoma xenopodis]|uniref:Uncharacterized protein n=1 Tax=Protopolystoma xenopodis TaxID=117903 RepID=A0A3S5B9P4_9PLAT|nr:unnamed protein product [Protopolystoma xenopodis]